VSEQGSIQSGLCLNAGAANECSGSSELGRASGNFKRSEGVCAATLAGGGASKSARAERSAGEHVIMGRQAGAGGWGAKPVLLWGSAASTDLCEATNRSGAQFPRGGGGRESEAQGLGAARQTVRAVSFMPKLVCRRCVKRPWP